MHQNISTKQISTTFLNNYYSVTPNTIPDLSKSTPVSTPSNRKIMQPQSNSQESPKKCLSTSSKSDGGGKSTDVGSGGANGNSQSSGGGTSGNGGNATSESREKSTAKSKNLNISFFVNI